MKNQKQVKYQKNQVKKHQKKQVKKQDHNLKEVKVQEDKKKKKNHHYVDQTHCHQEGVN